MAPPISVSHSRLAPHQVKPLVMPIDKVGEYRDLERIGIGFESRYLRGACDRASTAMDAWAANPAAVTSPSIVAPIQFLQNWLPGFVRVLTAARKIDELIGIETIGNWRDEWVVQGIIEPMGNIAVYKDGTNVPLADWNPNWNQRSSPHVGVEDVQRDHAGHHHCDEPAADSVSGRH
jgi:hypothetical protein